MAKKIRKKLMHFAQLSSQKSTKSGIFHFFRKSGSGRCSKCSKTCENLRKFKIQKKFRKINPRAFIWRWFHLNSLTSAFFTAFWNLVIFTIFDLIFENTQNSTTFDFGICRSLLTPRWFFFQKYNAKYSTFFSKIDQIMYFSVFSKIRIWSICSKCYKTW